jgi:hypothetical protein
MNRVHTYTITTEAKEQELNIIKCTLHNNECNINLGTRHFNQYKHNKNSDPLHQKIEWATFTYVGRGTKKITKFFKKT